MMDDLVMEILKMQGSREGICKATQKDYIIPVH